MLYYTRSYKKISVFKFVHPTRKMFGFWKKSRAWWLVRLRVLIVYKTARATTTTTARSNVRHSREMMDGSKKHFFSPGYFYYLQEKKQHIPRIFLFPFGYYNTQRNTNFSFPVSFWAPTIYTHIQFNRNVCFLSVVFFGYSIKVSF